MKSSGSVLIVVLGLLAILAIIGITFVTMSNLDRRTASNFAVQSQFILAADGAVDYVCHHLIQDLWAYNTLSQPEDQGDSATNEHSYYITRHLLSDHGRASVFQTTEDAGIMRNEPFDYPGTQYDPWLSGTVSATGSVSGNRFSYGYQTPNRYSGVTNGPYGIHDWGTTTDDELRPNNLGFPDRDGDVPRYSSDVPDVNSGGQGHGVWIPDLSFPFDSGLVRVSVTVVDHGGMLNLNAHGNKNQTADRKGYYISDVDPSILFAAGGGGMPNTFFNSTMPPGLWHQPDRPGNRTQMQVVIENPARYEDRPFSLAEEFELRRLTGTHYTSRLEYLIPGNKLTSAPGSVASANAANYRRNLTTVGWTAQVRPSRYREGTQQALPSIGEIGYQCRKVDLNLDDFEKIRGVIEALEVFDNDEDTKQFAANISAFRDGEEEDLMHQYGGFLGASRQPIFSHAEITDKEQVVETEGSGEDATATIFYEYTVKFGVMSPWERDNPFDDEATGGDDGLGGISTDDFKLSVSGHDLDGSVGTRGERVQIVDSADLPERLGPVERLYEFKAKLLQNKPLAEAVTVKLTAHGKTVDVINDPAAGDDGAANPFDDLKEKNDAIYRRIDFEDVPEGQGEGQPGAVRVVYVAQPKVDEWFTSKPGEDEKGAVPIRFPRSVRVEQDDDVPVGGLPPEWIEGISDGNSGVGFRAFRRVGDLNQVLCPSRETGGEEVEFWPWVPRIAAISSAEEERKVKFAWFARHENNGGGGTTQDRRLHAANIFTVGGPWLDRIDNDGDGCADATLPESGVVSGPDGTVTFKAPDTGKDYSGGDTGMEIGYQGGRFGGSEIRVAGKINLNTASEEVLEALGESFGISSLDTVVTQLRNARPIESPAQIVNEEYVTTSPPSSTLPEAKGPVEQRDVAYTLISNIATVRSDTFSIYGTVQYVDLQAMYDASQPYDAAACRAAVRRSRRFWALVDRSPCAAHNPASTAGVSSTFIRPRILNFQWMD